MSYLDKDTDVMRYQGQAFNYVAFDELTPVSYTHLTLPTSDLV